MGLGCSCLLADAENLFYARFQLLLALPQGHGGKKFKYGRQQRGESHCRGRWGREKVRELPGFPALLKAGRPHPPEWWTLEGLLRALLSLSSLPTRTKAVRTLGTIAALPQPTNEGGWGGGGPKGTTAFRSPESLAALLRVHCITFETIDISCGVEI